MGKLIAILDDEHLRQDMMRQQVAQQFPDCDCVIFDNALDMIDWLKTSLEKVTVISLDHDLGPNRERDGHVFDPGVGRDVVDFLASQRPTCPVIIQTTNRFGGDGMYYALQDAGWHIKRIIPHDDVSWIKERWIDTLIEMIKSVK